MSYGFALSMRILPSPLSSRRAEQRNPFAPTHYRAFTHYYGLLRPWCPASVLLILIGSAYLDFSLASGRQVPAFHIKAWFRVTAALCRMPSGSHRRCCTENFKSEVWALSPGSCGFLGGTDGIRATDPKHAIQNRDADGGFGLLTCKGPCPKFAANNPFVSAHVVSASERRP